VLTFESPEDFTTALGGTKKWSRMLEAIANAPSLLPDVTYSIGDSLTYRLTSAPEATQLTGHRRYLTVRHVLSGEATLEVAPVSSLESIDEYDDLSDRQHFSGAGERVGLTAGSVLVCEIDEALRDVSFNGAVMALRVTVEGAFFANK
jgi:evolved beta-galactosidase subunit beta